MQQALAQRVALAAIAALALLQVLWELWLAPLHPGGSWLALKALPLFAAWWALQRGRAHAPEAIALLLLLYFIEGVVRAWSETGRHALVAGASAAIALLAFAALYFTARR
jgi:uncharacterized membrane protein